jgi:hypothetical protein
MRLLSFFLVSGWKPSLMFHVKLFLKHVPVILFCYVIIYLLLNSMCIFLLLLSWIFLLCFFPFVQDILKIVS